MKRRPAATAISVELEVPFHDVDALHVVWHGWYCKYLELGRTALLRSRGLDAADVAGLGHVFYVVEVHLRHLGPARYGDRLRVTSWFTEVDPRIGISHLVHNLTSGKPCAVGVTVLATTTASGSLCWETPGEVLARLRAPGPGQFQPVAAGGPGGVQP